jgi:hypothetical protein
MLRDEFCRGAPMFLRVFAFAAVALIICPATAGADSLLRTVSGRSFDLAKPDGYCVPAPSNSADAAFVNVISKLMENTQNKAVQVLVDCSYLQQRRADANAPIYNYVVYYFPNSTENEHLDGDRPAQRKNLCDGLRGTNDATLADVPNVVDKTFKELKTGGDVGVSTTKNLGVLAEDTHACYSGLLIGVRKGNDSFLMNIVIAATVIHGKSWYVAHYSKFENPKTFDTSLQLAKATAASFDARNPD